jgi:hypothetical protein
MKTLQLWSEYSREEVHAIFSPQTNFTPQAGTWGLHGMVRVPDRDNDWVFFVTYGQEQGTHVFDESITEDGVLSWQSQPRLGFDSDHIKSLIKLDDRIDNIYLFLRSNNRSKYGYFGRLGYLTHDTERERPVYFQWQLVDWPPPKEFIEHIGITTIAQPVPEATIKAVREVTNTLVMTEKPTISQRKEGIKTSDFRSRKAPDYGLIDSRNRKLGLAGELLVLQMELNHLRQNNREDLAAKVIHVSVVEGDGAGYDIMSYELNGTPKYVEVKTTSGSNTASFFMSPNEIEFSKKHPENYALYRVYEFSAETNSGKMFIIRGDLGGAVKLLPTQFKAFLL